MNHEFRYKTSTDFIRKALIKIMLRRHGIRALILLLIVILTILFLIIFNPRPAFPLLILAGSAFAFYQLWARYRRAMKVWEKTHSIEIDVFADYNSIRFSTPQWSCTYRWSHIRKITFFDKFIVLEQKNVGSSTIIPRSAADENVWIFIQEKATSWGADVEIA